MSSSSHVANDTIDSVKAKIQEVSNRLTSLRAEVALTVAEKKQWETKLRIMKSEEATKKKELRELEKAEKQKLNSAKKEETAKKKELRELEKANKLKAAE
eukprot:8759237-Karenia_brevis.AAC.1